MRQLYCFHDSDEKRQKEGMKPVSKPTALKKNADGYGIFWTVNEFDERRTKENLKQILSWYVEIDDMPKAEQLGLIESLLVPTMVIESKNGFHLYFDCIAATPEGWSDIMSRINYAYKGDTNAKDITRVLRAPYFKHMKDPDDPFEVRIVWHKPEIKYGEKHMRYYFQAPPEKRPANWKPQVLKVHGGDFWTKLYNFDCIEGLKRMSGRWYVNHEVYDFRPLTNGNTNLVVNGKQSSVFIDKHGRIGSSDKGGPTMWQWLKWFGHSSATIRNILETEMPEVFR